MKTTPGPWRYEAATKTIRSVPANYWLATMDSFDGAVDHEANACLIAAAPDLLYALKQAFAVISEHYPSDVNCCASKIETIKAAIAKAEGRQ